MCVGRSSIQGAESKRGGPTVLIGRAARVEDRENFLLPDECDVVRCSAM